MAAKPVRFMNPVEPLPTMGTAMRNQDTGEPQQLALWSGAVSPLIGVHHPSGETLRPGDVDSSQSRRTHRTTPSCRTLSTATATGTTRTTSGLCALFADSSPTPHCQPPAADGAPFTMADLVQAWEDCRRHKRGTASALTFESNVERNLCQLRDELLAGTYDPGQSTCFVSIRPRPREVWAADFRARVVHHLLYNKISPRFYASFIFNSCACIPGRGTLFGAKRLESAVRSVTQNWSRPAYYLKLDLSNFFVAINKEVLFTQLAAKVREPFWLALTHTILFHDPRDAYQYRGDPALMELVPAHKRLINSPAHTGLPIGNLSSQFFANVYLNALDQFCKHQLRARHFVRYVDDFVLLHESAQWLNEALARITEWLPAHLGAQLNPKKTILQPVARGVDFVGHVIKPWRRTTRPRAVATAVSRLRTMPEADVFNAGNSYLGLLGQASHSHKDRATVANVLRKRGHAVNGDLTKIYRKSRDQKR